MADNEHVAAQVDDFLHGLLSPEQAERVRGHCASCPQCRAALEQGRRRLGLLQGLPPSEASEELVQSTLSRVADDPPRGRRATWVVCAVLSALAASILALLGVQFHYQRLAPTGADLIVLGQTQLHAASVAALRIRLLDRSTRKPLAGVPVKIDLRRKDGEVAHLGELTTDENGAGNPRLNLPDWDAADCELTVSAGGGPEPEVARQPVHLQRSWKVMVSSDKPVYQPGQSIRLRALALRKPDLRPARIETAAFTVSDPKGNVIFKKLSATSEFGITSADCDLASEILEGPYTVSCKVANSESKITVEVKKYVLPKFLVRLKADRPYYAPGQEVKLEVQADYPFGEPVAGATVVVSRDTPEVGRKEPVGPVKMPGKTPEKTPVKTDEKGRAVVTLRLPPTLAGRPEDGGDARVSFTATVTEKGGHAEAVALERLVTRKPLRVTVVPEGGTLVRGVPNQVYVLVSRADGTPLENVKVRLDVQGKELTGQSDERGTASFEVTPWQPFVGLDLTVTDSKGGVLTRETVNLGAGQMSEDFLVRTDRGTYRGGQTMKLTALGGGAEPVFVDLVKDGQTLLSDTVEVSGGRGEKAIDLPPDLFGTLQLVAYRFQGTGLALRKSQVVYVQPPEGLKVAATFDQPEYRPGKSALLRLALTDAAGKPAPGALSLAAVDRAVFAVLAQRPGMEGTFYNLEKELLEPAYSVYPAWEPGSARGILDRALLARTGKMEDLSGSAPGVAPSGVHSLACATYPAKAQRVEEAKRIPLMWVRAGWGLTIAAALLSVYAGLWYFLPGRVVLLLHGAVVLCLPVVVVVAVALLGSAFQYSSSKTTFGGRGMAMTKAVATALPGMMPEADLKEEGMAVVDDSGSTGQAAPPRLRQFFPETLLWKPELITDEQGKAELKIDLADSITTWELSASAVAADGRLGAVQVPLKVFQPFFVDLDLPVSLTLGDSVGVPVVVHNHLGKKQSVTLKLDKESWFDLEGEPKLELELAPHEVRTVRYALKVKELGRRSLQVTALAAGVSDAIKRDIDVEPNGRRVESASSGTLDRPAVVDLDVPADAVEGSAHAVLKLYPSAFSQFVEGLDGIFQMPNGCFEQTSSTTYPNILALDYLKKTGQSAPPLEAKARQYIHLGYQRLLSFEVPGGGFDWFGRPPAHLRLTAYGLMEFEDMARVKDVDPAVIDRTRNWLLSRRQPDGSWAVEAHALHDDVAVSGDPVLDRLSTTAYIAWSVFAGGKAPGQALATQTYLKSIDARTVADAHVVALVANALLAMDPRGSSADPWLDRLEELKKTDADSKFAYWEQPFGARTPFYGAGLGGKVETTALATLALLTAERSPGTTRQALAWLVSRKDPRGTWHSTQATVLALKALLAGTGTVSKPTERRVEIALGGHKEEVVIPADQAEVMKQIDLSRWLKKGTQKLTVEEKTGTAAGYQVSFRYNSPEVKVKEASPLVVEVSYDRTELEVGGIVKATVKVENRTAVVAPMVMVELPIPAGFALSDGFERAVRKGDVARYQVTGRQAMLYLRDLKPGKPLELGYELRATMPVRVSVAGARVYEYYNPQKEGRGAGARLVVK